MPAVAQRGHERSTRDLNIYQEQGRRGLLVRVRWRRRLLCLGVFEGKDEARRARDGFYCMMLTRHHPDLIPSVRAALQLAGPEGSGLTAVAADIQIHISPRLIAHALNVLVDQGEAGHRRLFSRGHWIERFHLLARKKKSNHPMPSPDPTEVILGILRDAGDEGVPRPSLRVLARLHFPPDEFEPALGALEASGRAVLRRFQQCSRWFAAGYFPQVSGFVAPDEPMPDASGPLRDRVLWILRGYRRGTSTSAVWRRLGRDLRSGEVRATLDALVAEGLVGTSRAGEWIRWHAVGEQDGFPRGGA